MKRLFDVALALIGLLVLAPVLLVCAAWIKCSSPGPACYRGARVGRGGRSFKIWKFRTMVVDADRLGGPSASDRDPRITPFGLALRKRKIDELPQLLNVVAGDMSLVGPRPEVEEYVAMYTPEERRILSVRPGITDFATLWNADEGALLAGSEDPERMYLEHIRPTKLRLQLEYIGRRSLWTDCRILLLTARTVVTGWRADLGFLERSFL